MQEIDDTTVAAYLRSSGRIGSDEAVRARTLTGGVSNVVLWIERPGPVGMAPGEPDATRSAVRKAPGDPAREQPLPRTFVIKQARGRLRVAEPWFCSVERIWREMDVLDVCSRLLTDESRERETAPVPLRPVTPRLLFEDRANYLFAMSAVDPAHRVWKSELLAGRPSLEVAEASGRLLGTLHAATWHDPRLSAELADDQYFDLLRVDPYYRHLARRDPSLAAAMERLENSLRQHPCGLVHGDFSPKNLLVTEDTLTLVDFEVGHYGDVAFDLGFFLSHLVLKTFHAERRWGDMLPLIQHFRETYRGRMSVRLSDEELRSLETRGLLHLAGCGLARLDGKSPVEYLRDEALRATIRRTFRAALESPLPDWPAWEEHLVKSLPRC